jgi:DUF1680 family protein
MRYLQSITNILLILFLLVFSLNAQQNSLVNTSQSPYARLKGVDMGDVQWTTGFWAERFDVCKESMVPGMWKILTDPERSHSFRNFEIAAGLETGDHKGPPFHDGDFYKWFEGLVSVYAITKDKQLEQLMDQIIEVIALSQREDGYIHTPVIIEQIKNNYSETEFQERLDFETYNMGHLMTAACVHYRATGKTSLLDVARKATDFLYNYYQAASHALAQNAICPSHYMGVTEMYRTTGDPRYLELARGLIDIRSMVKDGTDHNQDRIPFRQQTKAIGHAVRANYLYAGATDVYMETGDDSLLNALDLIWHDLVERKLYITGGCGALYDGVSPDGTTYDQRSIQQVHQAYGRDFQLPNLTAHNESCANIGNIMWNWRMVLATSRAQYMDLMELTMYNSLLAGVSLDGTGYFYTNPLCVKDDITFTLRWSKEREEYISYCNCCPPNTIRTVAGIHNYVYCHSDEGLWVNIYSGNRLSTTLKNGSSIKLTQVTEYPWDGNIKIILEEAPKGAFSIFLRIPGWSDTAVIKVNGTLTDMTAIPGAYAEINRKWKNGDILQLILPMKTILVEANPLVEETRNQVAVKRGPVVYCLESVDLPEDISIFDIALPCDIELSPNKEQLGESIITSLTGEALLIPNNGWDGILYREISKAKPEKISVKLIPYYAWGNRGHTDMTVWLPLDR